ncbi:Polygalacturonase [Catalinimonas alkaloidigena]|uniref:Polygalacturonase n=1 Tax=Catalinimonas alkaloidigena TaxID=1075417 RepID=A0A1G9DI72_9BACT|nr:glycoside hydrolase family 28 protein [Catalinimonas alkaloidigena]SDK63540.1 Polygalacturonase [Catalinimonas alkaloidigena]
MKQTIFSLGLATALLAACQSTAPSQGNNEAVRDQTTDVDLYTDLPFEMDEIVVPEFPDYSVNLADFGAVGDGQTLNTDAFAKAIADVSANGGGRVVIPRGIWLTGPIVLQSHINLHTERGAVVMFSPDFDLYPLIETSFEGLSTVRCQSPLSGRGLENIALTGDGVFDGSGDAWRPVKKSKLTASHWKQLTSSGGVVNEKGDIWYPSEKALRGSQGANMNVPDANDMSEYEAIKDYLRPVMVSLVSCKNVLLDGPTFQNSPAWCLHPLMCENLTVRNLTVRNPWYSQNGDGLDVESCKNVAVYNSSFDVGDDAICIKSGKDEDGRKRGIPTENLIVKNCTVYHGHGGFVVGSEMSGGVKNVHVTDCTFLGTDVGLRFKSTRGRGGVVENIHIANIDMVDIPAEPILFNLFYGGTARTEEDASGPAQEAAAVPPVTEETPQFKDIYIKDVVCRGAGQAVLLKGLPEMNIKNVNLENIRITEAGKGILCSEADGVTMKNVVIEPKHGPVLHLENSRNVQVAGLEYPDGQEAIVQVDGTQTKNISLQNAGGPEGLTLGTQVEKAEVKMQ